MSYYVKFSDGSFLGPWGRIVHKASDATIFWGRSRAIEAAIHAGLSFTVEVKS